LARACDEGGCLGYQVGDVVTDGDRIGDGLGFLSGSPGISYEHMSIYHILSHFSFLLCRHGMVLRLSNFHASTVLKLILSSRCHGVTYAVVSSTTTLRQHAKKGGIRSKRR
jgi:hypothetical protein